MELSASPVVKSFIAGAFSGTCSTVLFQPLDLVKTRLQTSVVHGGNHRILSVVTGVIQQDKLTGLWRGLTPSFTRTVPGIAVYFSSVHTIRSHFGSEKPSAVESATTGAAARSLSAVIVIPFTVLKTRYESGCFVYRNGLKGALLNTYKTEGVRALISGLTPTLMRDVPFSAIYLMFYTQLKHLAADKLDSYNSKNKSAINFVCGVQAGILASTITQPADVVKTLMQMYPKQHCSVSETAKYIYQQDGIEGFLRGIVPRTIRRTLMAAMAWTIYDEVARRYQLK